jgi:hypothetical protein
MAALAIPKQKATRGSLFYLALTSKWGINRLCLNACQGSFCYVSQHRAQDSRVDHDRLCAAQCLAVELVLVRVCDRLQ